MLISRRKKTIAGAAAVVAVIVVVVVVVCRSKAGIFKGCNGISEPIQEITISSCPDSAQFGYCEIKRDGTTDINLNFAPAQDYKYASFEIWSWGRPFFASDACAHGMDCPGEVGESQKLVQAVEPANFVEGEYKVQFNISYGDEVEIMTHCVEFTAKVV